jgi:C1A family cysteine protease
MKSNTCRSAKARILLVFAWLLTHQFLSVYAGEATNPQEGIKRVDLRPNFTKWKLELEKQGARNTCSVFTTVAAMEYALSKKFDRGFPLSEEYLNWACNKVINNTDQDRGQFFAHLLQGYEQYGICREEEMPYARKFYPQYEPSVRAINSAKIIQSYGLKGRWIKPNDGKVGITDEHIAQIKATLRNGWPVCGGSAHSVLLVGYEDDASRQGSGRFFIRDPGAGNQQAMTYAEAKARLCDLLWFEATTSRGDSSSLK